MVGDTTSAVNTKTMPHSFFLFYFWNKSNELNNEAQKRYF